MKAQLGNIVFEGLIGFSSWARDLEMTYPKHALISNKPLLASPTPELDALKVTVQFHISFCKPEDEIDALVAAHKGAQILPLILGNGRVIGDFVIPKIGEKLQQTDKQGNITVCNLDIELLEYYNADSAAQARLAAKENAGALASNNPAIVRGQPRYYQTEAGAVTVNVSKAAANASMIDKLVNQVNDISDYVAHNSDKIMHYLDNTGAALGAASALLQGGSPLALLYPYLPAAVGNVINATANMKAAMPITSINSVMNINTTLQASVLQMKLQNSPMVGQTLIRRL